MSKTKMKAEVELKKRKHRSPETLTLDSRKRGKKKARKEEKGRKKKTGPRLPSALRKELDNLNRSSDDDEIGSDGGGIEKGDVYEYEEGVPQEETRKNRRFDPVDNLEYQLPDEFEDEDLPSDDEVESDAENADDSDGGEEDENRHLRMLQGITGMPGVAFEGKKKKEPVFSDVHGMEGDDTKISIQDLLDPLQGKPGYSKLRKRLHQLEKKPMAIQTPLPRVERERLERKVAYEHSKKDITKWEPLVKRNREAPTIYFEEDVDLGYSTVGAIAYEFEPRTEFEKKMASLVRDPEVVEAHRNDGSRLLELNKISIEDVRDRENRLAKMRHLLFRHEMKAKRIKKIKSKTYHRMLKKDRLKVASSEMQMDSEAIKEQAMKQEFKRAEERMTLKHKNSSKWAKRILKRGLKVQDEGTRAALSEQLHQHALLKRKMNSTKDSSSSEDSSDDDDDDDELSDDTASEGMSKVLAKAKEKTLNVIEEEDEIPKSGVLSLPFMVRGLKKNMEATLEEGRLAVQEYDMSLRQIDNVDEAGSQKLRMSSGRKVFGAAKHSLDSNDRIESDIIGENSDSEAEFEKKENEIVAREGTNSFQDVQVGSGLLEKSEIDLETIFKSFSEIAEDAGPKTTYDVAIFASGSFRKMKGENVTNNNSSNPSTAPDHSLPHQNTEGTDHHTDTDSEQEIVDGILSAGAKSDYELPSQADLIHHAFAGDNVEEEFEKDKLDVLNEENPEPEKPVLLPGWGQWTHIQKKKGLPSWMLKEHEDAKRKREETLRKRNDVHLKHVIISEKIDKKAEKLHTKTLPFPFTSNEVFEQSIRMPIGPEYNPAVSVGALNRPAVVKKAGIIIKPIKFEEVDPHDKSEEQKPNGQRPKAQKHKAAGGKMGKKGSKRKGS